MRESSINWFEIKVVIFDVDGTLYDQVCLRRKMVMELLRAFLRSKISLCEVGILRCFRTTREGLADASVRNLERIQYKEVANRLGVSPDHVRSVVDTWIYNRPLRFVKRCRFPGVKEFFEALQRESIKIAVFSDYPASEKLLKLELNADLIRVSTDPDVDELKPNPRGLITISRDFNVSPRQCLMIGDRQDRDGKAASRAGMGFLMKSRRQATPNSFADYFSLINVITKAHGSGTQS